WAVMPMGLTNSPTTFQGMVNCILGAMIDRTCRVYLDGMPSSRRRRRNTKSTSRTFWPGYVCTGWSLGKSGSCSANSFTSLR
ncbi:hypothetical protein K437DRAFT_227980, partial [Tilletiaria anomala UBC 951]